MRGTDPDHIPRMFSGIDFLRLADFSCSSLSAGLALAMERSKYQELILYIARI